jgi:large subunit ribosomal protein L16
MARIAMTRHIKRCGYGFVFSDKPLTAERLRLGWVKEKLPDLQCVIKPGVVLYEMEGVTEEIARSFQVGCP